MMEATINVANATAGGIGQNITNDEGTEAAASGALRHDLGLPPVNTAN